MTATRIKKSGSMLWRAVWKAWTAVRAGVMQNEPQELMRQLLFENPWITNDKGCPLGLEHGSKFANWAAKGLQQIKDIWSKEDGDWHPAMEILRTTRS